MNKQASGDVKRFYFEFPLVRLRSDEKYQDVCVDGGRKDYIGHG